MNILTIYVTIHVQCICESGDIVLHEEKLEVIVDWLTSLYELPVVSLYDLWLRSGQCINCEEY